jgi:TadE-like protein
VRQDPHGPGDSGSAVVDFVLVGGLVTLLFLGLLQVGVDYYVHNVMVACVADGARYGAGADVADAQAGAAESNRELARALGARYATAYAPRRQERLDGAPVVTVEARVRMPLLAWFLPLGPVVHATGHALAEPH